MERLVAFGRGLFRLSLLRDVLAVRYPNDPRKLEREAYYRILLAEELALPGTTWPVTSLRDAFGFFEARLPVVANEVLKKESEHDFARLDDFMGAWKPWQAYIARDRPALIAGLKQDRQRLLDEAERLQANGAIAAAGLKAVREKLAQQQEVAVRELYRAQFRELRRSGKAGVSATGNRPEARHVEANRNGVADAQSVPASDRHAIPASAPH
jgi:hypothetical protein